MEGLWSVVMKKGKNILESYNNQSKEANGASKEDGANICIGENGVCIL